MPLLLCQRMNVSWREFCATPAAVIDGWLMVMRAETEHQKTEDRWAKRDARSKNP
jgi:hypothetical protein